MPPSFAASFAEVSADYLAQLRREGKSPATLDVVRRRLSQLRLYLQTLAEPPRTLCDLTPELVASFRDHEISRQRRWRSPGPIAPATVRLTLAILRGFFRHLSRRGFLLVDPAADLRGPRKHQRLPRQIPTPRQMKRLLCSPDTGTLLGKRDHAVLELLYSSGLRNAELCSLAVGDLEMEGRSLFVRKGKGSKERVVPMGSKAAEAVAEYLSARALLAGRASGRPDERAFGRGEPLFLGRTGLPLSNEGLRRIVASHRRRVGLSTATTPHTLRHACATHLLKGGAGIRQIQSLLGHASLESTEIYTKVETGDLRRMLDRHHPRSDRAPEGTC